jgi:hypothetical protein
MEPNLGAAVGIKDGGNNGRKLSPCIISIVRPETIERAWGHCERFLATAICKSHGELLLEDAHKACLDGSMQLWMVYTSAPEFLGAAVTQLVEYPQFSTMRIVLLGGKRFDEWKEKLDELISDSARSLGCKRMEAYGRAGFVRSLQGLGYNRMYTAIGKEL